MAIPSKTNRDASRNLAVFDARLIEDVHTAWMEAEADSEHALRAWFDGAASDRPGAYLAYRAAVDREEAAARELRHVSELTWPWQWVMP